MPDRFRAGIFAHAVATLHDQIDPGGGYVKKLQDSWRRPEWEVAHGEFCDEAAIGPEFDEEIDD